METMEKVVTIFVKKEIKKNFKKNKNFKSLLIIHRLQISNLILAQHKFAAL